MCGIFGFWEPGSPFTADVAEFSQKALDKLAHRGPDEEGSWYDPRHGVFFGHRRLSIIDLSPTGHQPMLSQKGCCITYNGEIFNYLELQEILKAKGYVFKGHSDTEVLLALYEKEPEQFINLLNGMFAFAIWDPHCQKIILVRDRAGEKSLYYYKDKNSFYFSSEIKALREIKKIPLSLNKEAIYHYLTLGYIPTPLTIYNEIQELPPGCYMAVDNNLNCRLNRYWQYNSGELADISFAEAVDKVEALLDSAVELRLRSDVPVGIFLSGGIDSGLVTAIAAGKQNKPLSTFTVSFDDQAISEAQLAKIVADKYNTEHHELHLSIDLDDLLPQIVACYDEPFADPSAIPTFAIAKETAKHLKVVLNGDGSDELFGGYRRHQAMKYSNVAVILKSLFPDTAWEHLYTAIPEPRHERTFYHYIYRFFRGLSRDPVQSYFIWGTDGFTELDKQEKLFNQFPVTSTSEYIKQQLSWFSENETFRSFMGLDFMSMLPDCLLVKMDIATMAHGLEARSPFLDYRLIEWSTKIPHNILMRGFQTKPLLRELAKRYLPSEVVSAPKRGFEIPLTQWVIEKFADSAHDICQTSTGIVREIFSKNTIDQLFSNSSRMEKNRWAKKIWILMMLGLWDQQSKQ